MCETVWTAMPVSSPLLSPTMSMVIMHPATSCTSITDAFITVAENVLQPISKRNETAIRTTQSTRSSASLPEEVRDGASFRATRCLLRRTHLRHHSLCQNLRRGRHFLPRFHFPVPVGEQVRYLSSEIPRDYLQPSRPKHLPLLRDRPGRHPCSGTSFSSRLARKGRWETYVSSLQVLCPRTDGQTTPRVVQYVWSHS